jgi:hypothetical protein
LIRLQAAIGPDDPARPIAVAHSPVAAARLQPAYRKERREDANLSDEMSYDQVIGLIERLATQRGTATLYVRTDKNRIVMVSIDNGRIVTLSSGPKRGESAIPLLQEMSSAVVRIEASAVAYHSEGMPSTQAILTMLQNPVPRVGLPPGPAQR